MWGSESHYMVNCRFVPTLQTPLTQMSERPT